MRLGIDLDGVVADFNTGWMERYNAEFGTVLEPGMVDAWDAMLPLTHFDATEDFWDWARNGTGPGLFSDLPIFPGALDALERLATSNDIVIITTKPAWAVEETHAWIERHRIPATEVHITGEKWRIDCDVYLDDGPHNLTSLVLERPDRTVCRFVQPWNHPIEGVIDIDGWDTFVTLVEHRFC